MKLIDIIEDCDIVIKERIDYIFHSFQKEFPDIRYDERSSIVGIGELNKHLLCYFRKVDGNVLIKFKAVEASISVLADIVVVDNCIEKTIKMFQENGFLVEKNNKSKNHKSRKKVVKKLVPTSPFAKCELVVQTQQTPGVILFENYEQLKVNINEVVSYYLEFEYDSDDYTTIHRHHKELKTAKNILEKTKREIINSYNVPLETVKEKIDELIDIIKVPFKRVDELIKENKTKTKKYEIYIFAKELAISYGLQDHMDKVFRSPAFFEQRWLYSSCSNRTWQTEIVKKLQNAVKDINYILSMDNENKAILLAQYYQVLSISQVENFVSSVNQASTVVEKAVLSNPLQEIKLEEIEEKTTLNSINDTDLQDFEILNCIANSINPYTGEVITGIDDVLKMKLNEIADKIESLKFEEDLEFIQENKEIEQSLSGSLLMAGKKWTMQEEEALIEEFKQGLSISDIAEKHKRKRGGVKSRLRRLGFIE